MRKRKGHQVWVTREGRVAKHPSAVKTGSRLLRARKKAKKAHKRLPRRIGKVGVASATIALQRGAPKRTKKRVVKKAAPKRKSVTPKRKPATRKPAQRRTAPRRVLRVDANRQASRRPVDRNMDVIDYINDIG